MEEWSKEQFQDFRNEMFWSVLEEAFLFELPGGAIDHTRDGLVKHGPWPPEACSRVLLAWFDRGWIALCVPPEQLDRWASDDEALLPGPSDSSWRVLEPDRARTVLAEPHTWTSERLEGFVCLATTERAPASDFRDMWLDAIDRMRSRL